MTDARAGVADDDEVDDEIVDQIVEEIDGDQIDGDQFDSDVDETLDGDGVDAELDDANRVPGATATDVLEYLVKALVDDPDAVEIDVDDGRRGLRVQVSVAPDDMGRVIGRRGRIANAIRTVVRAAAVDDGVAVDVDFVD